MADRITPARTIPRSSRAHPCTLLISDVHVPAYDVPTWRIILAAARDLDPDVWIMGDFLDLESCTRHPPMGGDIPDLSEEYEQGAEMLMQIHDALAQADRKYREGKPRDRILRYYEGNHEQRFARAQAGWPRAIRRLVPSPRKGLGLDALGWQWVRIPYDETRAQYGKARNGAKVGESQPHQVGSLYVHHGDFWGKHHAYAHLDKYHVSQVYGHTHRAQQIFHTTPNGVVHVTGLPCVRRLSAPWRPQPKMTGWVNGFGVIEWHGDDAHVFNIVVRNGAAAYGRHRWRA